MRRNRWSLRVLELINYRSVQRCQAIRELVAARNVDVPQAMAPLGQFERLGKQGVFLDVAPRFGLGCAIRGNFLHHIGDGTNHRLPTTAGSRAAVRLVRHSPASQTVKEICVLNRHEKRLLSADANRAPQARICLFLNGSVLQDR
jgi:hypothetical protein